MMNTPTSGMQLHGHRYGNGSGQDKAAAPIYELPEKRVVSVEHPCIVRNLQNGLKSMGGEPRMQHILDHAVGDSLKNPQKPFPEPEVGVSLRPDDPFAAKLTSTGIESRNVLVKVTLPKRTGRKRKRGWDGPFESFSPENDTSSNSVTAPELIKRIRDNEDDYIIAPVGMIRETHRFRGLPDFQTRASDVPIFQELNAHILEPSYSRLKDFSIENAQRNQSLAALAGPPYYAASSQPYRYEYQQAAGVKFVQDEAGNVKSTNIQAPPRKLMRPVAPDAPEVPQGPPPELKKHNPYGTYLPRFVDQLSKLLEERPLVTRRVAMNHMPHCSETMFREATQWVGYTFKAGPWRDSLIKYGVDPRKDPKYRIYQTLMFQLDKRAARAAGDKTGRWNRSIRHASNQEDLQKKSHVFDGRYVSLNGKTWQVCDITDPLLKRILDTEDLADECDVYTFGWYHDGTMCKARVIMREKMEKLFEGSEVPEDLYLLLATLPDKLGDLPLERGSTLFGDHPLASKAITLASDMKTMAKAGKTARVRDRGSSTKKPEGEEQDADAGELDDSDGAEGEAAIQPDLDSYANEEPVVDEGNVDDASRINNAVEEVE